MTHPTDRSTATSSSPESCFTSPPVLLITPWYGGSGNGVGLVVEGIGQSLRSLNAKCVVLHVVADGWIPTMRHGSGGELIVTICMRVPSADASAKRRLAASLRELAANLVVRVLARRYHLEVAHFHYSSAEYGQLHRACSRAGLQTVATFHGSDLLVNMADRQHRDQTASILEECRVVTTVSDSLKQTLIDLFPQVEPCARTVHNAVTLEFTRRIPAKLPECRDIDVLFVGNLVQRKGADVLLHAVRQMHAVMPSLRVVIAGDGVERAPLTELARQLNIDTVVTFIGHQDRTELVPLYCRARVLAVPSRTEPFGLVVVEGQMCGATVIASAVDGIPEIIVDGETGFLFPSERPDLLAATVLRVLGDEDTRTSVARAAHTRVSATFSPTAMAMSYRDAYTTAATPGARGQAHAAPNGKGNRDSQ